MNIIERLQDEELYVDAIDDAIAEIKFLQGLVVSLGKVAAAMKTSVEEWMRNGNACPLCRHHHNHSDDCAYQMLMGK